MNVDCSLSLLLVESPDCFSDEMADEGRDDEGAGMAATTAVGALAVGGGYDWRWWKGVGRARRR